MLRRRDVADDGGLLRPWWAAYGKVTTRPIEGLPHDVAGSFLRVCEGFIRTHAKEAERFGWQPAHLFGPKGLGRSWALVEFMPLAVRWEDMAMLYPSPTGTFMFARQAHRDGRVSLICGEATSPCVIATGLSATLRARSNCKVSIAFGGVFRIILQCRKPSSARERPQGSPGLAPPPSARGARATA